ncbi:unnamed protein product [Mycena citricolor]|uniref:Epoxide hydrolase N-terminal domain-containing protein n=1 Tax=Mycena citricolor TaxID=2018698 RepID=A0AAD2HZ46_9AGAR|nr:unnamed protein product [Mycena citricolor]CAK5284512.1 unnamed protein product [Mycena citricolor]
MWLALEPPSPTLAALSAPPTMSEAPYTIAVPDDTLASLHQKLKAARFPDELEDAGRDYGAPLGDIKRLVSRWIDGYDWRKHEAALNAELPQFTRDIAVDGHGTLNIHYVHKKSAVQGAIPLLFVHGWPGSFFEARKIVPLLVAGSDEHPSFHVVAMSLPGYGFSEAPKKKGFAIEQFAEVGNKLMLALGYNEYVTQGGDWGYFITRVIAKRYGHEHAKAWHTNFPLGRPPTPYSEEGLTEQEKAGLERLKWFNGRGMGYYAEQSTRPQTVGYALADSPVALLAWIYEKLVDWTDKYPWDDDEVLTWISVYWFSRAGPAASVRIYYEFSEGTSDGVRKDIYTAAEYPTIPLGMSHFPAELAIFPVSWTEVSGNVVYRKIHNHGGHFAAYEAPESLLGDLHAMFKKGGPAFDVVKGHSGYD